MSPSVYLETTIISYLTSRPSRDLVVAAHQQITRDWWSARRRHFQLFVSELVFEEASQGDRDAASRRLAIVKEATLLTVDGTALSLARAIVRTGCVPRSAGADALHVAIAAANGMGYLLTWNCAHINNAEVIKTLESTCADAGFECPVICTPEQLLGG